MVPLSYPDLSFSLPAGELFSVGRRSFGYGLNPIQSIGVKDSRSCRFPASAVDIVRGTIVIAPARG